MNFQTTFILDTSAILAIQQIFFVFESESEQNNKLMTTVEIYNEFKDDFSKFRIKAMVDSGDLKVISPTLEAIKKIETECINIGNNSKLSPQDKTILALAWQESKNTEISVVILSDDYEIQNTAYLIGLKYKPIRTKGIKYSVKFIKYCGDCRNKEIHLEELECPNCGSRNIKNKQIKKKIQNLP